MYDDKAVERFRKIFTKLDYKNFAAQTFYCLCGLFYVVFRVA